MLEQNCDDDLCQSLIDAFSRVFPDLSIQGGAEEPFYRGPSEHAKATIYFRSNYPRSLLHEMSHYCLAGPERRKLDDFGYWYFPCGRSSEQQQRFEAVEARPQGLEKAMCAIIGLEFLPSIDDFSGRPPSKMFLEEIEASYNEMRENPPLTAQKALLGLINYKEMIIG